MTCKHCTPEKTNHVVFILDKSGSMASLKKDAIGSFNEQLDDVNRNASKYNIRSKVSVVTFSSGVQTLQWAQDAECVEKLTEQSYQPAGSTALYDAVGNTISQLEEDVEVASGKTPVLINIISDGEENASQTWKSSSLAALVKAVQARGNYTITYSGANVDLTKVREAIPMPVANTQNFQFTSGGIARMSSSRKLSSDALYKSYSVGATASANFFQPEDQNTSNNPK